MADFRDEVHLVAVPLDGAAEASEGGSDTPGEPVGHEGVGAVPDTDRVPDASRVQPPLRLQGGTQLDLQVHLAPPITEVASSLHAVRMDLSDGVTVAPSGKATLNKDFVLRFATAAAAAAAARAWSDGSYTVVAVEPPVHAFGEALPRDAVFVVDISGSMSGTKMEAAKVALKTSMPSTASPRNSNRSLDSM